MNQAELIALAGRLLGLSKATWNPATVAVKVLIPDGSSRRFFQLRGHRQKSIIAILPSPDEAHGHAEARAFDCIGQHLHKAGVSVPKIFGFDRNTGLVLCEDLGNQRLFEAVTTLGPTQALPLYEAAVRGLAQMSVRGADGFDPTWCWDTAHYDQKLMLERESGYFLRACCTDFLGISFDREAVAAECAHLARQAAQAPAQFFLHRDFQSRNIMLMGGTVRFIDFQGGRFGPLAYDLASLLLDPYGALPDAMQEHLLDLYLHIVSQECAYDPLQFRYEYVLLALQRTLQILGAFAFLSQVRHKPFFAQFLQPALHSLARLLTKPEAERYHALNHLTGQCCQELCKRS